jgi:hypothetical protein
VRSIRHKVAVDVHHRLEDKRDPVVAQTVSGRLNNPPPGFGGPMQDDIEDVVPVSAAFLGTVHGSVRAA